MPDVIALAASLQVAVPVIGTVCLLCLTTLLIGIAVLAMYVGDPVRAFWMARHLAAERGQIPSHRPVVPTEA